MNKFFVTLKKIGSLYIPIFFLVLILSFILKIHFWQVIKFFISSISIIVGVSLYLVGYDLSYPKISDKVSLVLLKKKNMFIMLFTSLILAFIIVLFEPELLKVSSGNISLLIILAISISIFFVLSIYRILSKGNYKYYIIISYIIVFLLMMVTDKKIIPFSLERSALSMGLVSAPFLITMGMSLSKKCRRVEKSHTSFGILGLSSIGPMMIFMILGIFYKLDLQMFHDLSIINSLFYIFVSLIIIFLIYLVFLKFQIRRNKKQISSVLKGLALVFLGITLFLLGSYNYSDFSRILGQGIRNYNIILIIMIMFIFAFFIIRVEPSFNFLMNYVVEATTGGIKEKFLEFFLGIGASIALVIAIFIVKNNLDIIEFLLPSFFLAVVLAFLTPNKFLGIAMDSLGAVVGTISSTFFIPFLLGINSSVNTIGILAFIGIIPVIFLEIAGFIYEKEVILHDYNSLDERIIDYD